MGSRKTVRKPGLVKGRSEKGVRLLARSADAELGELLLRSKSGTLTRVQLDTGLKEVKRHVREMEVFLHFRS